MSDFEKWWESDEFRKVWKDLTGTNTRAVAYEAWNARGEHDRWDPYVIIKKCEVLEHQPIVPPIECPFCTSAFMYEKGHKAAITEMSKPQSPDTCKHDPPHRVSALVKHELKHRLSDIPGDEEVVDVFYECSICAEVASITEQLRLANIDACNAVAELAKVEAEFDANEEIRKLAKYADIADQRILEVEAERDSWRRTLETMTAERDDALNRLLHEQNGMLKLMAQRDALMAACESALIPIAALQLTERDKWTAEIQDAMQEAQELIVAALAQKEGQDEQG